MMQIEYLNPTTVYATNHYTQLVKVQGGTLLLISGQVALDAAGELIGKGDLEAQTVQVFENLKAILASVSADFSHVVKLNIYIVNYQFAHRLILLQVQERYIDPHYPPASTLLGIDTLARPDLLIEIEAMAVLPPDKS